MELGANKSQETLEEDTTEALPFYPIETGTGSLKAFTTIGSVSKSKTN